MENIAALVRERRSVRTFDGRALLPEDLKRLNAFLSQTENPYQIPVVFKFLEGKELKCPVVSGTELFIGAKAPAVPHMEEAVGYSFEKLVLYAQSLGIGTVWVGGTMNRAAFEQAIGLAPEEKMPCMSPLGYPAKKMSVKETVMRKAIKANNREPFEALFFKNSFDTPLTKSDAALLAEPLEALRWAPSAVNKQPWRAVWDGAAVHFYLKHAKGFVSDAVGDMQKIDMGIALCHFELSAKENKLEPHFCIADPGLPTAEGTEYIASYRL